MVKNSIRIVVALLAFFLLVAAGTVGDCSGWSSSNGPWPVDPDPVPAPLFEGEIDSADSAVVAAILALNSVRDVPLRRLVAATSSRITSLYLISGPCGSPPVVYLDTNHISVLPNIVGRLSLLRTLSLDNNLLEMLPDSIGNLRSLHALELSSNRIIGLPDQIVYLDSLTQLNLSGNVLTQIPDSIGRLLMLNSLGLQDNRLIGLPVSIGDLSSLQRLSLRSNELEALPGSVTRLTALLVGYVVTLGDNRLCNLPDSVAAWATSADKNWRSTQRCN